MKLWLATAIVTCLITADAQRPNMRVRAAQNGGSVEDVLTEELPAAPLSTIFAECDLALLGRVLSVTTHLMPDASNVVTDYKILPLRIMKQTRTFNAPAPSQAPPIVVQRLGGVVTERGMRFNTSVDYFEQDLKPGEEAVLFLKYLPAEGSYNFKYGPFGAFRVSGSDVHPLSRMVAGRRGDKPEPLTEFLARVKKWLQQNR